MADEAEKKVILRSDDEQEFEIDESLAKESKTLTYVLDYCGGADKPMTLPKVNGACLAKIIEYWRAHRSGSEDAHKAWDEEFVKMGRDDLFAMIISANYLDTEPLFELLCATIADNIKNMSVEDFRDYLGIENDFTPEEWDALKKENRWAFD